MMRLELALFADAADIGRSGKVSLVGANFETITAETLPATILSFTLMAFFAVPESDVGIPHTLSLTIEDPSGENLAPPREVASVTPQANPHGLPVRYVLLVNLGGLPVRAYGKHMVHLIVDGEEAGTAPFVVVPMTPVTSVDDTHEKATEDGGQ